MTISVAKESTPPRATRPSAVGKSVPRRRADPLDQLIWYLGRAYYTYVGVLERALDDFGLSKHLRPGMGHIIFTLFAEDDLTIKEIAIRSQLANSTLTGLLDRMETGRLVERRRDEKDGRLVRIRLTPLGRSLEPRASELVAGLDAMFHDRLGEKGVRQSKRLLRSIIEAMRDADAERDRHTPSPIINLAGKVQLT